MKKLTLSWFDLWIGLFLVVLLLTLFGDTLFTPGVVIYSKDATYFYPNEVVLEASGYGDDFLVWNPYFGGGAPGLGKIQVGMFYLPLMLLRPFFSVETTLDLDAVLHLFLAGAGVYLLMRQLAVDRIPALFAAVAFMLSGSFAPRLFAGHASVIRAVAWSGWLLFVYIRLLHNRTWRSAVFTALVIGLVITGGHPQMSLIVLILPLLYFFALFLPECVRARRWRVLWSGFFWSAMAVMIAVGLTAVQILPYLSWLNQTVRAAGNAFESLDAMVQHSFLWQHFLTFFMPTAWYDPANVVSISLENKSSFWESSAFSGVLTMLILGIGLTLRSPEQQANRRFFAGLAVAALLFSMGTINPLYEFLYRTMPYIRAPGRFMLWWTLATAVTAGITLDILLKNPTALKRFFRMAYVLALSAIFLMVGWKLINPLLATMLQEYSALSQIYIRLTQQTIGFNIAQLAIKLSIMAVLFWLIGRWREYGRYWGILLVLGLTVEMSLFAVAVATPMPLTSLYIPESRYSQFAFELEKHRFDGYRQPPLYLIPTLTHVENGEESSKLSALLETANGTNLLAANFKISQDVLNEDWQLEQRQNGWNLFTNYHNLPRIYAAPAVHQVADDAEALKIVGDLSFSGWQEAIVVRPTDQEKVTLLNRFHSQLLNPDSQTFSGRYLSYRNNQLEAEVITDRPMMIIFSEMYDDDWRVLVNGQPDFLWRVNYTFRGVLVDAGTHIISMEYHSSPYRLGAAISLITLLSIVGMMLYVHFVAGGWTNATDVR